MSSSAFLRAKKQGDVAEKYVAGMFSSRGLKVSPSKGYNPRYDQLVSGTLHGKQLRFLNEIKYDKKSAETGNVYLDIQSLKKSQASILTICLNDPIDTVLMLPLKTALDYAVAHTNVSGGEFGERSCLVPKDVFISELKPRVLTTNQ